MGLPIKIDKDTKIVVRVDGAALSGNKCMMLSHDELWVWP
jgi:hypothetical protein